MEILKLSESILNFYFITFHHSQTMDSCLLLLLLFLERMKISAAEPEIPTFFIPPILLPSQNLQPVLPTMQRHQQFRFRDRSREEMENSLVSNSNQQKLAITHQP